MDPSGETTFWAQHHRLHFNLVTFRIFGDQNATLGTSINDKNAIKMHPNPSSNVITFNKTVTHLNIVDLSGKLVLKKTSYLTTIILLI